MYSINHDITYRVSYFICTYLCVFFIYYWSDSKFCLLYKRTKDIFILLKYIISLLRTKINVINLKNPSSALVCSKTFFCRCRFLMAICLSWPFQALWKYRLVGFLVVTRLRKKNWVSIACGLQSYHRIILDITKSVITLLSYPLIYLLPVHGSNCLC